MTLAGWMNIYECDYPGCRAQMVCGGRVDDKRTGWRRGSRGDFCEKHPHGENFSRWAQQAADRMTDDA